MPDKSGYAVVGMFAALLGVAGVLAYTEGTSGYGNGSTPAATPAASPTLNSDAPNAVVCVKRYKGGENDFRRVFAHGPFIVPKGTVFQWEGHRFGPYDDPQDEAHMAGGGTSSRIWKGLSPGEQDRRDKLVSSDLEIADPNAAFVITSDVRLSSDADCADVFATAVTSPELHWSQSRIFRSDNGWFVALAILGKNGPDFAWRGYTHLYDSAIALGFIVAAPKSDINGSAPLPGISSADRPAPAEDPPKLVQYPGQKSCFEPGPNDPDRPDVTCVSLSEKKLLSLAGLTREQVQTIMRVPGQDKSAAHFRSDNFRPGSFSGDVTLTYNADDRVSAIQALVSPQSADGAGDDIHLIWNESGYVCSDFGASQAKCPR